MATSSLRHYVEINHGKVMTQNRGVDIKGGRGGGGVETYVVSLPCVLIVVACLVKR